jgi:peptidoglycan glycosyltransferase
MSAVGRREILSYLAWRHAAWFGVGLAAMAGTALLASPRRLARLARKKYLLPVGAAGLLVVTWLVGPEINGRRLWLVVGQMSLQTVEAVKLLMVLFVASYFSYEHPQVINGRPMGRRPGGLSVVGPYTLMHGLPLLALAVQKDFGPAVLIYAFFLVMLYLAAGSRWLVFGGLVAMVAAGAVGYWLHLPRMLHFRVRAWLDPFEASEHLTRGLWSLADGGLWGTGGGGGSPQTVPLSYSDFAFVSLAEELGFLGGAAVVTLFLLLAWRGMVLAARCRDPQDRLLAAGITVMITLQAVLVLGGVTGLIPLAGLTLPFVSHGGSSLVVNMIMAGLLIRIARDGPAS